MDTRLPQTDGATQIKTTRTYPTPQNCLKNLPTYTYTNASLAWALPDNGPMVGYTDLERIANLIRSYVDATHDNPAA